MSDDAPLILSKADLKAEHREIYNNILRENGGESAFGAVDLDRIATIAKLQQDLRNDKLEPMERVKIVEAIDRLWARLPIKPKQSLVLLSPRSPKTRPSKRRMTSTSSSCRTGRW